MWQRIDLKTKAKQNLNICYWKAVLTALILGIVSGGGRISASVSRNSNKMEERWNRIYYSDISVMGLLFFAFLFLAAAFIAILIKIFLFSSIEVGCRRFFLFSRVQETELNEIGFAFSNGYWNVVKVQFLRSLFTYLWSLLFVIPGIIKSYEYRMIPYLLAENPNMPYSEAFRISKELMDGQKWETFILDLSFFGWAILTACTCGILGVFYVAPYIAYTDAELYVVLQFHRYNRMNSQGGYGNTAYTQW